VTIPTRLTGRSALILAFVLTACDPALTKLPSDAVTVSSAPAALDFQDKSRREVALGAPTSNVAAEPMAAQQVRAAAPSQQVPATGMIIRNGYVSLQVDSIEIAIERVRRLTASLGGHLGNVSIQTGEHQVRSASLAMKIPAVRFDSAMQGMGSASWSTAAPPPRTSARSSWTSPPASPTPSGSRSVW